MHEVMSPPEDDMRKLLLIGISTFALGAAAMASADQLTRTKGQDTYKMLELFGDVLVKVKQQYVVPVDDKKLIQAAIDGMLTSLDPHSGYLDPSSFGDMREETRGQYGGLGLEVTTEEGAVKVISPMDGTPAAKAGVMAGDFITAIDGNSIVGMNLTDAVKQMRGAVGTSITLTIARERQNPFTLKLTREVIDVKTVHDRPIGDIGYLRISGFDERTGEETTAALKDLKSKIPHMKGLVLDLRNNPGGLVDSSVEVASDLLDGGEIVSQRGRDAKDIERYNARPNGDLVRGVPITVLINNGTASAAEIVSGALKDRQRATIIGLTSFGKGSVQTVIPLRNGADGALKLTTARYYTPSGQSIQKTGIIPDLQVARSKAEAEAVTDAAMLYSEASFKNALDSQEGKVRRAPEEIEIPADKPADKDGDKDGKDTKDGKDGKKPPRALRSSFTLTDEDIAADFQLQRALDVLRLGGVTQARTAKPAKVYSPPKPAFAKIAAPAEAPKKP
jgi:carboxyl-terminal processing protease